MKLHCTIRCILIACLIALAISLLRRSRRPAAITVSDNGIVPADLLQRIANEDAILARPVPELNLDGARIGAALQRLSSMTNTRIDVDWHDLAGAGIDNDAPVHVHLRNATLAATLTCIADSEGGNVTRIGFDIDGQTIHIATIERIERRRTVEAYNVRGLARRIQSHTQRPAGQSPMSQTEAIGSLMTLIANTCDSNGSTNDALASPAICEIGGLLVVRQTPQTQRQITTLLTRLDAELRK
ncbi:MAG TPA: hypothetical protein VFE47_30750 [Tepidisphaeraceae bacterium]|jgi:hypothetical protein|nr:hypothetical protein [Tepidisphaeraceae bacterium]